MTKYILGLYTSFLLGLLLLSLSWPDSYVHLVTCDVGQGDAVLFYYGSTQILVDAGKDDTVLDCLETYVPFWDKTIEFVIITHPDFDHYGGIRGVLERYKVNNLAQLPLIKEDAEFELLQQVIQRKKNEGMRVETPIAGSYLIKTADLTATFIWPSAESLQKVLPRNNSTEAQLSDKSDEENDSAVNLNDLSLTLKIEYKEISILLTGDLESNGELALVKSNMITPTDILKVGHHGSKTSSTMQFLQKVRPEIALLSLGKNNQYNHPDQGVVSRLEEHATTHIYRTDQEGSIHLATDGVFIWKL